jgi:hypothetical protein
MRTPRFLLLLGAWAFGEDDRRVPPVPPGLPQAIEALVHDHVRLLTHYQNADYARLYMRRLGRFVDRNGVDPARLRRIAELLAERMVHEDLVWHAQRVVARLTNADWPAPPPDTQVKPRLRELAALLPESVAGATLSSLEMVGWTNRIVTITLTGRTRRGRLAAHLLSSLRRFRPRSVDYAREKPLVERWLHMIDRALARQPEAVDAVIESAHLLRGHGEAYGCALANWRQIIDRLAKPVFDGDLVLPDLGAQVTRLCALAEQDRNGGEVRRAIEALRAGTARAA